MNTEELAEELEDLLPSGYSIEVDKHGQIIIFTGLIEDEDGELIPFESEADEESDSEMERLEDDDEEDD